MSTVRNIELEVPISPITIVLDVPIVELNP